MSTNRMNEGELSMIQFEHCTPHFTFAGWES